MRANRAEATSLRICQLSSVDFAVYHFLMPLMSGLRDAGHEVVAVCGDGPLLAGVRSAGFRVETVPVDRGYNVLRHLRTYRALVRLFRNENFDVVHVHTPIAALVGRFAARRAGVKRIVYTAHGFYFHENMPLARRFAFVSLEWLAGRVTDILLTQSEEDALTAQRLGLCRTGVIHAIGNGVDPATFHPVADRDARTRIRQQFGTRDDAVVVIMIGRLVAEKGYPELFEAMKQVDAELWVVGERLASDHNRQIASHIEAVKSDSKLAARIRFLGYRQDVPALLRAADVFTLPSHREGMPRSVIEAMMTGLPVVASNIRGIREEVLPGETGLLVPAGDVRALTEALRRLASDAGLRRAFGAAGRARALELFDEARIVSRQLDLLGLHPGRARASSTRQP